MSYNNGRRSNNRGNRNRKYTGSKTERMYKPVPRISTLNRKIKKIENDIELKYVDTVFGDTVDTSGDLQLLNSILAGTSQITRVGSEINATSIQFRLNCVTNDANTDGPCFLRVIMFWDRQANGTVPTLASDPISGAPGLLNNSIIIDLTQAPYQYENSERFRVLYDKVYTLNPRFAQSIVAGVITEAYPVGLFIKKKVKLNRKIKYDAPAAGIGSINTNSLYMAFISSEAANAPTVNAGFRLYFKDA